MPDDGESRIQVELLKLEPEIQGPEPEFLKIDRATVRLRLGAAPWSDPKSWEILERGDSVALLLHNIDADTIVLARQFRAPVLKRMEGALLMEDGGAHPTADIGQGAVMLEAIAGMIKDEDGSPEAAILRETEEEVGYVLRRDQLDLVATYFPSPGACSERIFVFCAQARASDRKGDGGGSRPSGEFIAPVEMPVDDFFAAVDQQRILDSKLLVGATAFRNRVEQRRAADARGVSFAVKGAGQPLTIRLRPGDIAAVDDVEVWVNSENTLMQMDQYTGGSVSARIRSLGAEIDKDRLVVVRDTIAEDLRRQTHPFGRVPIGGVVATTAGRLRESNGVRKVFHVATVLGRVGLPVEGDLENVAVCVDALLQRASGRRSLFRPFPRGYESILLPMIGAGKGGLDFQEVFPRIAEAVRVFAKEPKRRALREVNLSILKPNDFSWAIRRLEARSGEFERVAQRED